MRNGEENDKMEDWDEKKLDDVINQKHGEDNKKKNTTQIVIFSLNKRKLKRNILILDLRYKYSCKQ